MEALKYPIGRFQSQASYTQEEVKRFVNDIRRLPALLEMTVQNLDQAQLNTPYRPEGWTVTQLVHHVADSHMNAYIRLKLTLTEDKPTIKPYEEAEWAKLPDTAANPINVSLTLLHALHRRWVSIFDNMEPEQWERSFIHPATGEEINLKKLAALYSWHGMHHLTHIRKLKERMNWQ
ncbi:YfiT family bacillithiol transferase [Chitinophaga sp. Cy-1792]|uniref:YfiT family bacillithiol transferase n=1 Tax=Chitinophaga sp. Cy-1792 TaxID=2608339 RepID=UPI001423D775|nr:putative metal-dependent hydrolase [Chitinophaga sp. Cy-1792]NIG54288.1 putative metal-dependent hydrolase [Chitinophaga sp. Cy-1792]